MQHFKPRIGMSSRHGGRRPHALTILVLALGLMFIGSARAQTLQDFFTNRITVTNFTGLITQNNSNATVNEKVEDRSRKSEIRNQESEASIRRLKAENAELKQRLEALEQIIRNQKFR